MAIDFNSGSGGTQTLSANSTGNDIDILAGRSGTDIFTWDGNGRAVISDYAENETIQFLVKSKTIYRTSDEFIL